MHVNDLKDSLYKALMLHNKTLSMFPPTSQGWNSQWLVV